ncbi:MAG: hypothetical protein LBT04_01550 [Prevotellaceae bacterium]|jgi:hypothetical protein|nr:hypothetical protein [Prevotellaceae bacterium]
MPIRLMVGVLILKHLYNIGACNGKHPKRAKQAKKAKKRLKTIANKLLRELERKMTEDQKA